MCRKPLMRFDARYFQQNLNGRFSPKRFSAETHYGRIGLAHSAEVTFWNVVFRVIRLCVGRKETSDLFSSDDTDLLRNGSLSIRPALIRWAYFLSTSPMHIVSFRKRCTDQKKKG
jgi:hypothetical protein